MVERKAHLSPRLQCVAERVIQGALFADIGTDHGYLPAWLLQSGRIKKAIVSDLHSQPLERARATMEKYGLLERTEFRLCNGLDGIFPDEVDTVAIAGMGGESIIDILSRANWNWSDVTLLLQPMTKVELLRSWLVENGFAISDECLAKDRGILYTVLTVVAGAEKPLHPYEIWCGRKLQADPLYREYAHEQIKKLETIAKGLRHGSKLEEAETVAITAAQLRQTLKEWEYANGKRNRTGAI